MKGRKPKPTNLKVLQGNPGRRPIEETLKAETEAPDCPEHLADDVRAIWDETVIELMQLKVLARVDKFQLETYCNVVARCRRMQRVIDEHGEIYETRGKHGPMYRQRPEVSVVQKCESQIRAFAAEWGMTAQSRARLKADPRQGSLFDDNDPTAGNW